MKNRRIFIYIFLFSLTSINYIDRVALSVAAQPIAHEFGISPIQMGYLFSSFIWTYFASLIIWGIALDRWGTRWVNAIGMAVFSLATVATGFAWSYMSILVTRLVMGAGEASSYPAGGKVIREWMPARERGIAAAVLNSGSYAGPAIGAIVVAFAVQLFGWRTGFILVGSSGTIWLFCWLMWFRKPELATFIDEDERALILRERNGGLPDTPTGPTLSIPDMLKSTSVWGLLITQAFCSYAQFLFLTWLPSYLQTERHLNIVKSGYFTALPYALSVILAIVIGRLSDRLLTAEACNRGGQRNMVAASMLLTAVVLTTPFVDDVWIMVAVFTLSLTGAQAGIAMNIALLGDLLPSSAEAGRGTGLLITGGASFAMIAPIATGYVVAITHSYNNAFYIAGVLALAGAFVALTMTRQPIRRKDEVEEVGEATLRA
ncbi:putative glucarate transporter [Candidatus Burkholderia verschuerenii]|uniref:Putative glucarate transporter n=1 Tax=Candidatus Burkholderia verschuerenii TaxID=242163 RepID=A0A0L0M527_9BURK|nr:MFS transporter [Candidatus Burkholderia verschuerenii]KND57488.1 putative glucarate transporter [Candidatus Burkholderia verschuerenii]